MKKCSNKLIIIIFGTLLLLAIIFFSTKFFKKENFSDIFPCKTKDDCPAPNEGDPFASVECACASEFEMDKGCKDKICVYGVA